MTGQHAWTRLGPLWHLLLAAVLAVPTAITLLDPATRASGRVAVAASLVAFTAWHWFLLVREPSWARRPLPVIIYWVGALAYATVVAGFGAGFVAVLYGFYPLAFVTLGWWGMVPIVALATTVTWRLGIWEQGSGWVSLLATASLSLVIAAVMRAVERQSAERQEALQQLAATRAELAENARRTGVLEERQRLAREMHDTVAQGFISIVTQLEAADQALPPDAATARTHVDTARRTARAGLGEVRRSVAALRSELLDGATLPQALQRTAALRSADDAVPVQVRVTGDAVALHPDTETALLRTAQEALTNVVRHARATRAVVTLSYLDDTVTLDIDDDGTGFDVPGAEAARDGRRYGLVGMRERIAAVGGRFAVESTPGEGTTVAASVPT